MLIPTKLFTVIIPAYNYAATLPRAVESVIPQLSSISELIVIDDGSTDSTPEVLAELSIRHSRAFRFVRKKNGGLAAVRNTGIDLADGQFLVFLDADDELSPGALKALAEHIAAYPETRFVAGGHVSVQQDGTEKIHTPGPLPSEPFHRVKAYLLDKTLSLANGACAMHRDVFLRAKYPESFRSAEDVPVFAQVLANETCTAISEPLARIHKHGDSLRHNLEYAKAGGVALVEEVFLPERLGPEFQSLKSAYYVQRCLSLFRSAYISGDTEAAKRYFKDALGAKKRIVFNLSYMRKAARLWLGWSR